MIILQKIIENKRTSLNIPSEWLYRDLDKFGLEWKLFSYQKEALENIISVLYLIYRDTDRFSDNDLKKNKTELFRLYQECGLSGELVEELAITKQNENFEFLSKYFTTDTEISFQNFINRAAFWMATGCGKTLVMIKLLVILSDLMYKKLIPKKDILILAPKDEILSQIKDHINKFNKGAEIKINLRNLKEWERIKNQQDMFSKSEMNVFYYRADNIGDKGTVSKKKDGQRIDYESIYNNGNWYLILDEAHKGEKETSKRQQYFMVLTQNGFLFNFSATFTDELDKITTVFDYKLDIFLREGYGKKLYISDSDFKSFSVKQTDDFSEEEKKSIIAQTLIIFALAKKHFIKLNIINNNLYHSPLLITLANSVNTEEADLKLFYMLLSEIARGRFDFERTKRNLVEKLENQESYLFGLGEIDDSLIGEIRTLGKEDFFKNVFHTEKKGNIEVAKFRDNDRELAFKHVCADKYFMLIVASDIIKWEDNVLEGYQWGRVIEESFFEDINKRNSINILLGSRIFSEGWDTNRPNIINFINIGVSDDAQKFVLQSIGRGIRIEPLPNKRKRFDTLEDKSKFSIKEIEKIEKENKILESLFVFATNKEVVKNILVGLEKQVQAVEWIVVKGIKKNERVEEKDLPIFIPVFKDGGLNNKPFWIGNNEYKELSEYVQKSGPKVLLLKNGIKLRTFKKISDKNSLKLGERRRRRTAENILFVADNYFNESAQVLDKVKVLDGEISHYQEVRTNLDKEEVEKLEKDILKVIKPKKSGAEIFQMVKEGKITQKEFEELDKDRINDEDINVLRKYLDFTILEEHYYKPILYRQNTDHFQHILKNKSEIDFLFKLKEYLAREDNLLKKCEWWYFSKIDENIDKIGIPYFDEEKSKYRTFCPDFIFWIKQNNKYYLKFIDPKGIEYTTNPASKIDGFNEFLEEYGRLKNKELEKIDLFYFNAEQPHFDRRDAYRKYWTDDFNKIFSDMVSASEIVSDLFFNDVISEDSIAEYQKYTEYLPVLTLEAAATVFGKEQHVEPIGWKKVKARKRNESLFIAHVVGKSMEPTIPDGAWCLFRFERGGSRNGLVVLVESRLVSDAENHQRFTIKRYHSEKQDLGSGEWRHKQIILSPDNKTFKDIMLENVTGDDFRVIAEFVEILK